MSNDSFFNEVKRNRKQLKKILFPLKKITSVEEKISLLTTAAQFLASCPCGRLNSALIERELGIIAQKFNISLSSSIIESSILHVFTACWLSGGHTQVARRWIENSPPNQTHSVIFTNQPNPEGDTPLSLKRAVANRGGKLIYLDKSISSLKRALQLRQIASGFEKIILHMHMEDIIPVLAFATPEFERPVAFFNHADHLFSLGVSISDLAIHFREFAFETAHQYRGMQNNVILPLPMDPLPEHMSVLAKKQTKENLGIHDDAFVILSLASEYKFAPFDGLDFGLFAKEITQTSPNVTFLLIGPDRKNSYWENIYQTSSHRVVPLGFIPHDKLEEYLAAADIALDSFPFSSFLSLLDIAKYNIPCFSLSSPLNPMESFQAAGITVASLAELRMKIFDRAAGKKHIDDEKMFEALNKFHSCKAFSSHLRELYQNFPVHHTTYNFKDDKRNYLLPFEVFYLKNKRANIGVHMYKDFSTINQSYSSSANYFLKKFLGNFVSSFIPIKKYRVKTRAFFIKEKSIPDQCNKIRNQEGTPNNWELNIKICQEKIEKLEQQSDRCNERLIEVMKSQNQLIEYHNEFIKIQKYLFTKIHYAEICKRIFSKYENKIPIKVGFSVIYDCVFPAQKVFEVMLKDNIFEPIIIVTPDTLRGKRNMREVFNKSYKNLHEQYGKKVVKGYIEAEDRYIDYSDDLDMIYLANSYDIMTCVEYQCEYLSTKNVLTFHIPYGFWMTTLGESVFQDTPYNLFWRIFIDSHISKQAYYKKQIIHGDNVKVTGCPKMDALASAEIMPRNKKRIIIAPHHTIEADAVPPLSTFLLYADFFLELPALFPDVEFVLRPHPLLIEKLRNLWGEKQVEQYFNILLANSNTTLNNDGDVSFLFMNSDAMIHDCGSYTAEYLFTGKPCCYMLRQQNISSVFSELGKMCLQQHYLANTKEEILDFIKEVVLNNKDPMKEYRRCFVDKHLMVNFPHAAEAVIRSIKKELGLSLQ